MAELSTPIVLNFPDRGACAIDYIDYFDEGLYGPDKAFFVGRFSGNSILSGIAAQMNTCLSLQNTPGSMIHVNRTCLPDKWMDPLTSQNENEKYPKRAQYKIRFILRIKFYGEYAYVDLGSRWRVSDDLEQPIEVVAQKDSENISNNLEVVNFSWISKRDAEFILNELYSAGLSYDGSTKYDPVSGVSVALSEEELAAKEARKAEASAIYLSDGETIFADDEGMLTL